MFLLEHLAQLCGGTQQKIHGAPKHCVWAQPHAVQFVLCNQQVLQLQRQLLRRWNIPNMLEHTSR